MENEKRLIDANAFFDKLKKLAELMRQGEIGEIDLNLLIASTPTVDAVEVVHARWRWGYNSMNQYGAWCAECECGWEDKGTNDDFIRVQGLVIAHKYCPNCGAKMDGGNEDA